MLINLHEYSYCWSFFLIFLIIDAISSCSYHLLPGLHLVLFYLYIDSSPRITAETNIGRSYHNTFKKLVILFNYIWLRFYHIIKQRFVCSLPGKPICGHTRSHSKQSKKSIYELLFICIYWRIPREGFFKLSEPLSGKFHFVSICVSHLFSISLNTWFRLFKKKSSHILSPEHLNFDAK